jgi:protein-tyrosine phosphatase
MRPTPDSYWVIPGQLLAGAYPGARRAGDTAVKLTALLDAGVRSFVDLTESHELEHYESVLRRLASARDLDVRYRRMSITDMGTPTADHMSDVIEHMRSEIENGRPLYVHCWGGIGRTGTTIGCWLVANEGMTAADALARITTLRKGTADAHRRSPETQGQEDFIAQWEASCEGEPRKPPRASGGKT